MIKLINAYNLQTLLKCCNVALIGIIIITITIKTHQLPIPLLFIPLCTIEKYAKWYILTKENKRKALKTGHKLFIVVTSQYEQNKKAHEISGGIKYGKRKYRNGIDDRNKDVRNG